MTEYQLTYFITIVQQGSYNKAALELNISQSSVSKQIMLLENELGVKLFNREYHHIKLTPAGEKLLPQAKLILENIENMKKTSQKLHPNYIQKISVLVLPIIGHFKFYFSLNEFKKNNPNYSIDFIELEEPELYKRIINGDFDIAITYHDHQYYTNDNIFKPIIDDEVVVAVNLQSELAQRKYLSPSDLKNQSLLLMEKYTCLNHLCSAYLKKYDILPHDISYGRPETILGGVEANCGIALVSHAQAKYYANKNIKLLPIFPSIPATLGTYVNKNEKKIDIIEEFIKLLSQK